MKKFLFFFIVALVLLITAMIKGSFLVGFVAVAFGLAAACHSFWYRAEKLDGVRLVEHPVDYDNLPTVQQVLENPPKFPDLRQP